MTDNKDFNIDAFLLGVPKGASTWIYRCLQERDDTIVPSSDSLRFFDMKYHKGYAWYQSFFQQANSAQLVVDPSPTYLRSQLAAERIHARYPDARFIICLRNPVERAFSQFWHEKKEGNFGFEFKDVLDSLLLNSWFIETGNYATQLETWFKYFPQEQFHIVYFEDLKKDPLSFIKSIYVFLNVDDSFIPSVIDKKVNEAGVKSTGAVNAIKKFKKSEFASLIKAPLKKWLNNNDMGANLVSSISNKKEYEQGMSEKLREELLSIYMPQIIKLEKMLAVDLSSWKQ